MIQIGSLAQAAPVVSPADTCGAVYEIFRSERDLLAVPVVADGVPRGLVNRQHLLVEMAGQFGRPLFERKPITVLMDAQPLIVEADISLDTLNQVLAADRPAALTEGFIITRRGRYEGLGTALSVLQANMAEARKTADQLETARFQAEAAVRSKSLFLANMSHELRTPLNAIIGFTDVVCQEQLGPIRPAKYGEYIEDVNASGKHLLNVINAILDMSKIEAGRLDLDEDYHDPHELIVMVVRIMRGMAERASVLVRETAGAGLPLVRMDMQLYRQMLMNLLSNAIKFSDPGSEVRVEAEVLADGRFATRVVDEGCGIAPGDLARVMEPFGQGSVSRVRRQAGTGLGLPLVKALAEAHGGALDLDSLPGLGTTVTVTLPAERVASADAMPNLIA
ncbi:two-component system cell cycle sensor histidine kinase PleC [Rhodothalassium salexigens DSM 2132]|uniref:histidine kinase n=1 Tax=Rhodothalassium salexigens DSM 2132 TaxID=1188247 RepID=A0A4R2PR02_RHOSA|nr:HAMP domain-containing sensor histidine kinase [Rhodothalassium salexigens]MBB4209972.1 two-component system cell cycle sensor histidine kinase PleC [Rhodothalassium salexigens DSM 2132]TCP38137.1 two-component system cell cycle sensor histidine kinase PleC [Rhodothalassium salexigens DSM 2132]